jgi:hypothetical protein
LTKNYRNTIINLTSIPWVTQMKTRFAVLLLICSLAACSGIPLRSLPRLIALQNDLLTANPAEFMLAIQVDARMAPPPGAAPMLQLTIRPTESGGFAAIDEKLPMRFTIESANTLGLKTPNLGRKWLIYCLSPEAQTELVRVQTYFKGIRAQEHGGTIGVGIAQDGVAAKDPALANTRWESWLQTSRQGGFFELWSGSVDELLKLAKSSEEVR